MESYRSYYRFSVDKQLLLIIHVHIIQALTPQWKTAYGYTRCFMLKNLHFFRFILIICVILTTKYFLYLI